MRFYVFSICEVGPNEIVNSRAWRNRHLLYMNGRLTRPEAMGLLVLSDGETEHLRGSFCCEDSMESSVVLDCFGCYWEVPKLKSSGTDFGFTQTQNHESAPYSQVLFGGVGSLDM